MTCSFGFSRSPACDVALHLSCWYVPPRVIHPYCQIEGGAVLVAVRESLTHTMKVVLDDFGDVVSVEPPALFCD